MSDADPEFVADCACVTGEGPLWHPDERRLYWVDIPRGRLFRYDPASGDHERVLDHDGAIGGFTIQEDGDLLLFLDRGRIVTWNEAAGMDRVIVEAIPEERESRFNDVIADPRGRVFCGTMPTAERGGRLYRLDVDGSLERVLADVAVPNGLGFTPDRERLYVTESDADRIHRFDYDVETGAVSNRETFVDASDEPGTPDGMTVDADGYVWSAYWDGGCAVRYAPDGTEVRRVEFPARKVASVTFGGDGYADAYVATAGGDDRETEGEGAGALFRFRPEAGGVAEFRSTL